ncbi:hypothetical protein [Robiginitalea sediminis]|uniref:hypothetical protein n=1 Tax=Robiginitalea sediminis TaxID=1982593 RepID=UPI000B4ADF70|nr:hypothetical protein [Robiginitalea sediminis]
MGLVLACRPTDTQWLEREAGNRVLDLKYINDSLGLVLWDIRTEPLKGEKGYTVRVYLEAENPEAYSSGHYFYLHFYPRKAREGSGAFSGLTTRQVYPKNGLLVFEGTLITDRDRFEMLRYGLVNPEKKRLFTLAVDTMAIELR